MRAVNFRFDDMKHIDKIYKMSRTSLEMVIQLFLAIKEDLNQHGLDTSKSVLSGQSSCLLDVKKLTFTLIQG